MSHHCRHLRIHRPGTLVLVTVTIAMLFPCTQVPLLLNKRLKSLQQQSFHRMLVISAFEIFKSSLIHFPLYDVNVMVIAANNNMQKLKTMVENKLSVVFFLQLSMQRYYDKITAAIRTRCSENECRFNHQCMKVACLTALKFSLQLLTCQHTRARIASHGCTLNVTTFYYVITTLQ